MNLFEIDNELLAYLNKGFELCVNEDGEIDEDKMREYLEILPEKRQEKLEAYGMIIKQLDAEEKALKAEIDNLTARMKSKGNLKDRLKNSVSNSLTAFGENKFETTKVVFSFRKSESVEINTEILDKAYLKEVIEYKADKTAIKNAIKSGLAVTGAELVEKRNLQVK